MRSIRRAILTRLLLGSIALVLASTVVAYFGARSLLTTQFDSALRSKFTTLASRVEQEGDRVEFDFAGEYMPEMEAEQDPEYFQLWVKDGCARSKSLGERDLPKLPGSAEKPETVDLELPDGRAGRALGQRVTVLHYSATKDADPGPAQVVLVVARGRQELDNALATVVGAVILAGGLLVLISHYLVRRTVDRGLQPVADLATHTGKIVDPARTSPFPTADTPVEIRPIADSLNRLVERIARLLESERRTSANIAHELRTPVSELLLLSGIALRCGDEPQRMVEALEQVREVSMQMRHRISTLLEIARYESGRTPLETEAVELAPLLDQCWEHAAATATEKRLSFARRGDGACVESDRVALTILVANLIGNALEYSPQASKIECGVEPVDGACALWIENPAPDLDAQDVDKLAEPFWRASRARESREHAGLGLALVRRLSEILGADLTFRVERGMFRVTLLFRDSRASAA